ncbi:MAG: hypothetical protein E7638_03870 [Ruminococcaceae bacterium]|nr:hypothetical protein [Oscillospiraceae bacterium]
MKKIFALLMALTLSLGFVGCGDDTVTDETNAPETQAVETEATETDAPETAAPETAAPETEAVEEAKTVMTHAEYIAAEMDTEVTVEAYVQATQSWWDNTINVYAADADGAYYLYNLACSEEDAAKLIPGAKIKVTGFKGQFEGEVEILDGTFEFVEGAEAYIAEALDVTALLGTEELINHQNEFVSFKGITVDAVEFKNGEPGDDVYLTVSKDGATYSFCLEVYLTGPDTEVYQTVSALTPGTVCDMEGFLYWYQGVNPHITSVTVVEG